MNAKRVLVTGAAGFVGAVLVRRLVRDGFEVHAAMKTEGTPWRLSDVGPDVRLHAVDLRDEARTRAVVDEVRPEVVYHLAAHGAYPTQTDADGIIQTNIIGTWNLLRAVARSGCLAFVSTGSSSEYGFKQYAMRESDILEPNSYYAVSKCAQTLLCQHFARVENLPLTTFRLFSVYGPFEEPSRLVPTLIRNCLDGVDLTLVAADTARDFVYVDDVVDACLRLDELAKLSGEIVNLGTGLQSTVKEVVDLVVAHTESRVAARYGAMEGRIWDQSTWVADCTKSRRLLGWIPRTSLSDGLRRTIEWTRGRRTEGAMR
jgi:nucleoside-diphosphate-sugar epimerase